ncbi:MAG: hypothetical protein ACI39G_03195 [Pseudoramibacter sp.]
MNRVNTTKNADLSPERKRFGLFCLIMDALYVILGLCFFQYSHLPAVVKNILPYAWIALMGIALVVAIIGIFTSKVYDLFRCSLFETIILIAQGVWLGCSKSLMLTSNPQSPFPLYFLIGLFCIFGIGLAIQIDTVWCRSIMHFMTKGAESDLRIAEDFEEEQDEVRQPVQNTRVLRRRTTAPRRQQMAQQAQTQPRVQVISQSQAKTAIKQSQAKARAKQVLAEDYAQNNRRSAGRSKNQNTAQVKTAQPRKQPAASTREHIFIEPEKPAAARPKKTQPAARADQTAPVRVSAQKPRQAAQPRKTATVSARRQPSGTRETVNDATMKWEPSKIRKAEAAAEQLRQREQRRTTTVPRQTASRQTTSRQTASRQTVSRQHRAASAPRQTASRQTAPRQTVQRRTAARTTSSQSQASPTPTLQWATQRKRRPKTHHYARSSSNHLFIRDDDDE